MRRGPTGTDHRTLSVATGDYFAVTRRHMRGRLYTNAWTLGTLQLFMEKMSCELLLHDYPKMAEVEELRSTYIANCVFNSFLSYTAIMLNIVTLRAMRKTLSLPKTLKTLLVSLAVSDVGDGWFSESAILHLTSGKMVDSINQHQCQKQQDSGAMSLKSLVTTKFFS